MDNLEIFLPTRGRTEKQVTLSLLPVSLLKCVTIACHPGEEKILYSRWGSLVKAIIPIEANHIGEVRQKCIDLSKSDYIIFVDDSLNFHVRAKSDTGTITKYLLKGITDNHFTPENKERHMVDMFTYIDTKLRTGKYGMVGISRRSQNSHQLDISEKENERVFSFWGINRKLYNGLRNSPKFTDMQLKEDFYITLHFLTNGIPTLMNYTYAYGRVGGANSKGGCAIYRSIENSNKSAFLLQKHFPSFVRLRKKSVKTWGGEFKEVALDVVISTKKAYQYGINYHTKRTDVLF